MGLKIFLLSILILPSVDAFSVGSTKRILAPFTIDLSATDYNGFGVSCNGVQDGAIDLTIVGGTAPFQIVWSNGATSEDISGIGVGTYIVTVTDADLDVVIDSVEITEPLLIAISAAQVENVTCYSFNNGLIDINISGGAGSYSFNWSDGSSSEDILNLGPGNYTVTVTDVNNCTADFNSQITEPDSIELNISVVNANAAPDGEASVNPTGGTGSFTYEWSTGSTLSSLTGLLPGSYTVTVTDANNCTASGIAVVENALGACSIVTDSVLNVTCEGLNDGAIYINTFAAIQPVTYQWSDGSSSQDLTGLAPGTYTVTITDVVQCTATETFVITEPDSLELNISVVNANAAPDGEATVNPTGGTGSFTYEWSTGSTLSSLTGLLPGSYTVTVTDANNCTASGIAIVENALGACSIVTDSVLNVTCAGLNDGAIYINTFAAIQPVTYQWSNGSSSQDITGLAPGTYTVTITDDVQCTATETFVITEPDSLELNISVVNANAAPDGEASVIVTGGTGSYTYEWSTGSTLSNLIGLLPGNYTITVTDANNCSTSGVAFVQNALGICSIVTDSILSVSCSGLDNGAIYIDLFAAILPVTYQWSDGSSSQDITGLAPGTYTVTITDLILCNASQTFVITEPDPLVVSLNSTDVTCGNDNGSTSALITGGTGTYSFLWSNGQITQDLINLPASAYTLTVTDENNCSVIETAIVNAVTPPQVLVNSVQDVNCFGESTGAIAITVSDGTAPYSYLWSNAATTEDISGLASGSYTVTVTDSDNCIVEIATIVNQPISALNDSIQIADATCGNLNGALTVFPYGGTSPYSYLWNTGATSQNISGLSPVSYTVTVTDANLCSKSGFANIVNIPGPELLVDSVSDVSCNGDATGSIYITTSGGQPPFDYLWSNSTNVEDLTGLSVGVYELVVTDFNNCSALFDTTIIQPDPIEFNLSVVDAVGAANGEASIAPAGGAGGFGCLWSTGATSFTITGLLPGNYTVTVTDANLCSDLRIATVQNALGGCSIVTDSVLNVTCNGLNNGAIYIDASSGIAPITYQWSNGAITEDVTGLAPGTYTVTITDQVFCTDTETFVITEPDELVAVLTPVPTTCGNNNGAITSSVSGGTGNYTYLWSGGQITAGISGVAPGTYTVTVTDENNCTDVVSSTVVALSPPVAAIDSLRNVNCFAQATGGVFISVTGGAGPLTYLWSNAAITQDITNVVAGTYTVTVTDANSCTSVTSGSVTQPLAALNDSVQVTNATCGISNGSITIFPYNGTSPYTYLWNTGSTAQTVSSLAPGSYTVTITDANLCTRQRTASVTNIGGPVASLDSTRNVACFGQSTGGVFISVAGGTAPITYLWSNAAITQDISNVAVGTYTVTVTDANSCTSVTSGVVSQPVAALNDSVQVNNATCGNSNGSITIFPYNGTSPYTYLWNTGSTAQTVSPLAPGSYTVTITDANLCTRQRTASIINVPGPVASVDSTRSVACFGQSTGGVFISVTGGTAPLTYLWSNAAITQDITNLAAGTYTVTVSDANSCTSVTSSVVTQPLTALNDSVQVTPATCGNANGAITVFPYNGTSPYTYQWNTGSTAQTISGLTAGPYTVTITDANLCTRLRTANVTNPSGPVAVLDSTRNVACFGQSNGAAYISVSGGTAPLTYLWSNAAITQDITNIAAGTYTVTVTDANSCVSVVNAVITQPVAALNDSVQVTNARCGVNNGSITVFPYNGTSPYTYLWNTGSVSSTINSLAPGSYTVTITDANLCTRQRTASIINVPGPVATLDSTRNVACFGLATGGVFISVTGGTSPISYLWSNAAITQDINNVASGTYTVTVTDANLCTSVVVGVVSQPAAALNDSVQVTNATCGTANGAITVFPYNGTSPYTYLWNTGSTAQTISSLNAGSYTVTITDANLCTRQRTATIINQGGPVAALDSIRNVRCFGQSNGAVYISISGGTTPISYSWSNGAVSQDILNVIAGTYTVTVTDANSCTSVVSATVNQPIAILNDSINTVNATCGLNNGSATIYPYNGTSPYTFLWSNGLTTQTISGLAAGTYTVTITDANQCIRLRTRTINSISFPTAVLDSVRNVRCFGASTGGVFISAPGSVLPVVYQWSNGASSQDIINIASGTYTVTVTDANSCTATTSGTVLQPLAALNDSVQVTSAACGGTNGAVTIFPYAGTSPYTYLWNTGAVTQTVSGLGAGLYTVTVTDANSCTKQRAVTVNNIGGPAITLDSIVNVDCFGQSTGGVYVSVSGGTAPLTYLWSNAAVTQDIVNLASGTYSVTVTDANSCSSNLSASVDQPLAALNDSVQVVNDACGNSTGSITVYPFDGTGPYAYLWNTGQITQSITGLATGSYTVTVTDANLCTIQSQASVITGTGPVAIVDSIDHVTCFGDSTGNIFVSVTNGAAPLNFLWSNGSITQNLSGVPVGTYTVTVTDANLCTSVVSGVVNQPLAALNDSAQVVNASCNINNGSITVFSFGGTSPYDYLWSNLQTSSSISGLTPGTYTVTVTDSNFCSKVSSYTILNSASPVAVVDSVRNVRCFGGITGAVYISVNGGLSPYTYLWSNGAVSQDLINVASGNYTVTVSDANGCTSITNATVTQPLAALNDSVQVTNATCGNSNGAVTIFPFNGTSPYTYLWNTSAITQTISGLSQGLYTVTVTDSNLCTRQRVVSVNNIAGPTAVLDSVRNVRCFGASTGGVFISAPGGTNPKTYLWSSGQVSQDLNNVPVGTYTVTVTDANGCTSVVSGTVTQPLSALNDSLQVNDANCGAPTGSATVFPFGGTPPYTFLWSTGSVSATIFNLNAGSYTVTITDAAGCTKQDVAVINNSGGPQVSLDSIVTVKCFGDSTGGIYISVAGGTIPYTYQWSNGTFNQDLINVAAGLYTVTVTDDNNCSSVVSSTVTQPTTLNAGITTDDATCGLANGEMTVLASGGVFPYTYLWSNGLTSPTITSLVQGVYTVTVTDLNSCSVTVQDTVFNTNGPVIALDSIITVSCFGDSTGGIFISTTGGVNPLTFQWSNGAVSQDITGVPAGTYTVTVSDANSCTISGIFTISQPDQLNDSALVVPATCGLDNGEITEYPYGGTQPYTYLWNTSAITPTISNLQAGTYTVTVTDDLGCTLVSSYTVIASSIPVISTDSVVNVNCNSDSTGAIYISINGGSGPYDFNWSNGAVTEDNLNIPAGVYTLILTDAFQCADTSTFTITQPPVLQDSLNTNPATCGLNNGSAKIYPYGGVPGYSYQWSNGQTSQTCINMAPGPHTVTVTDNNGCILIRNLTIISIPVHIITTDSVLNVNCNGDSTGAIFINVSSGATPYDYLWSNAAVSQDIQNVPAGTYTVTVTDSVNCAVTQSFTIQEPTLITAIDSIENATCGLSNGSISLTVSGGVGPYDYLWSNAEITPVITGLDPDNYTVTITDANNCSVVYVYSVTSIGGATLITDSIVDPTCFGGNDGGIYITVIDGTAPYTFEWSNTQITEDLSGLLSGTYTVTVTDSNNCETTSSFNITDPLEIDDLADVIDATCGQSNGSITLNPSGGTAPYTYLWNDLQVTPSITGLSPGTYTVTVTDSLLCENVFVYNVNNFGAAVITLDSLIQINCAGDSTGAIYINVTGAAAPYSYVWSNFESTQDITNLPAGTYTVTVTDQNNCTSILTNVINEPAPINVVFDIVPSNCNASNGSIQSTITGGVGPYTLEWNTGQSTPDLSNLTAATYTLTVTDQNNCERIFIASVNNLSAPVITVLDSSNVTCFGLSNGSIIVGVTGGQEPYNYSWTNTTQTGDTLTGLAGNTNYTLTLTDNLGCIAIRSVFISQPAALTLNAIIPQLNDTFNLTCSGSNDGSIRILVSGGAVPYTYIWSNLALSDSIGGLAAGTYTVTVTDANSCTTVRSFVISQPPLLVSNAGSNNVICGVNADTLDALPPTFGTGYWTVVSGTGTFADSLLNTTAVTDLSNGVNVFQWVVTDGVCSAVSQVVITYNTQIVAIPGSSRDVCENTVLLTATAPEFGFGYWQIVDSNGLIDDTTKAVTQITGLNPGPNILNWIVVNGTCSDTARLVLFLNDPEFCIEELELPTGFTPNEDGKNDYFVVKGLDDYPDNSIIIYNRWGNKVYEKSGYLNDWDGVNMSGEPLPEGTYFVIFKVKNINRILTTYVDLRR